MNFKNQIRVVTLVFLTIFYYDIFSCHNSNRIFYFLESKHDHLVKEYSQVQTSCFFLLGSNALGRSGGTCGIHELPGKYNLNDVFKSFQTVNPNNDLGPTFIQDLSKITSVTPENMNFSLSTKVNGSGIILGYEHVIIPESFSLGFFVPVLYFQTQTNFFPELKKLQRLANSTERRAYKNHISDNLDLSRRRLHQIMGFDKNYYEKGGLGDFDTYIRIGKKWDYRLLMKSIFLNGQCGVIWPTGIKRDINNPLSLPIMGNGHMGIYLVPSMECELKHDLKVGFIGGIEHLLNKKRNERLATFKEPFIWSSLVGRLDVHPGYTLKLSPYISFENIVAGLDFGARYTYLRHGQDRCFDIRQNITIDSYLTKTPNSITTQEQINNNINEKKRLSSWRAHIISLRLDYDFKKSYYNLKRNFQVFTGYDIPVGGRGTGNVHNLFLGFMGNF